MINLKKLTVIGYMKKDRRQIMIQYDDITEVIDFERYQSEGVLNQIDSLLKEFYRTESKKILERIPRNVNITINTFYKRELPVEFISSSFR